MAADGHKAALAHEKGGDPLGRITQAVREDSTGEYLQYDLNGNVTSLERIAGGDAVSVVDFSHDGNRMTASQDAVGEENAAFTWWEDGNLKTDSKKNLRFRYNLGNLPTVLTQTGSSVPRAWMVYLADGTRVMTRSADGSGRAYRGSFVYSISGLAQAIESIAHDEGRFLAVQGASGTEFIDTWHVRDYLGSVRAVYDITPEPEDVTSAGSQILEQNDYYAFGGRIDDPYQPYDQTNRYRYNGKEQLRFEGINLDPGLTDYGARYYAPAFGRWTTPDPLADKYYSISPYAFCNNNPINFVDPDGAAVGLAMDVISVGCGVYNLVKNIKAGNTKAAWGDAAGIGVDLVCAIVPGLTVGAGATKTLGKAVGKATASFADLTIDAKGAWRLDPFKRGFALEDLVGGECNNFPVIDFYDKDTRTAISIKSLDLNAKSYQSGNVVFNKVKGYIDKLSQFTGAKQNKLDIGPDDMQTKVLKLVIPKGASQKQIEQLQLLREYAQQHEIQFMIIIAE